MKINREAASWLDQDITWWVNGNQYHQITGRSVQARGGVQADWVSLAQSPLYIILNVAVGGGFPGNPNSSTGAYLHHPRASFSFIYFWVSRTVANFVYSIWTECWHRGGLCCCLCARLSTPSSPLGAEYIMHHDSELAVSLNFFFRNILTLILTYYLIYT